MEFFEGISLFLAKGGGVLWAILALTFLLWSMIVERAWFMLIEASKMRKGYLAHFYDSTFIGWERQQIREMYRSQYAVALEKGYGLIKMLIALLPLFGLLGTVIGMIEVFDVMADFGSSNPRAMAAGVSMAIIPTMAAMLVSISGLIFIGWYRSRMKRSVVRFDEALGEVYA